MRPPVHPPRPDAGSSARRAPAALATLAVAVVALAACHPTPPPPDPGGTPPPDGGGTGPAPAIPFALGVEYTELGLGSAYTDTGVEWAKTRLEAFEWAETEPAPPVDGVHTYDWQLTDALVTEWQAAGMRNLQSYLSPKSPWASAAPDDPMPRPEHRHDYRQWVEALVERYDGDGDRDMPGLLAPIRHWVVGGEWTGFWGSDDPDDYLEALRLTNVAARAVYPDVQLGAIPFYLHDVFEGNEPTAEQVEQRLANPHPIGRNSGSGVHRILDHPELFDFVNVHALGDYTEVPPTLAWFRAEMAARGYERPIWIDDAFPISFLANQLGPGLHWPAEYPVTEARRADVFGALMDVAGFDPEATAWLRAETAAGTVKKTVTALGEGARGINVGNTEDWAGDTLPGLREPFVRMIGAAAFMGMTDVTHPNGLAHGVPRVPGAERPAWHALKLLVQELEDGAIVDAERVGGTTGLRGYRFERRDGSTLWAVWHEDGELQLPGEPEVPVGHDLPVEGSSVTVTTTPTADGEVGTADAVPTQDGAVSLALTSVPTFVEVR